MEQLLEKQIKKEILELKDEEYRKFTSSLLPGIDNVVGVRLPKLREIAKRAAKSDEWKSFVEKEDCQYFEEVMVQGMILGYVKTDIEKILKYVELVLPRINNWSQCDSMCTGLKCVRKNQERVLESIKKWIKSDKEFEIRVGVILLLDYYVDEKYTDDVLMLLDSIKHDGYYVKMGVAWAVSICYVKFPEKTMAYLNDNSLDDFTYNKSLQKIIESYRVSKEDKDIMRSMKRK